LQPKDEMTQEVDRAHLVRVRGTRRGRGRVMLGVRARARTRDRDRARDRARDRVNSPLAAAARAARHR
jgi:hypothetical protein